MALALSEFCAIEPAISSTEALDCSTLAACSLVACERLWAVAVSSSAALDSVSAPAPTSVTTSASFWTVRLA